MRPVKKRIIFYLSLLCLISVMLFSACSPFDFFSADDLLKPPKLTGEQAQLQHEFESAVGDNVALLSPLTGDYRSAYIICDTNADGSEEAVVFYMNGGADKIIHMHLLVKIGSEWRSADDITGSGSEVYKVEFCNLDNDSSLEVAVTWTVSDTKRDKTVTVYKLSDSGSGAFTFNPLATFQIFDYIIINADADGINELFYLYYDTANEKAGAYVRMLKFSEKETTLIPMSEVKLSSLITSLVSFRYDVKADSIELFIDCLAGENTYFSEIVVYDKNSHSMSCPIEALGLDPLTLTKRSSAMLSSDVNDDGLIEIPVELVSSQSYEYVGEETEKKPLTLYDWERFESGSMISIKKYFISTLYGFKICLDPLNDIVYIVYDRSVGEIRFMSRAAETEGELLFVITEKPSGDFIHGNELPYSVEITEAGKAQGMTDTFVGTLIE